MKAVNLQNFIKTKHLCFEYTCQNIKTRPVFLYLKTVTNIYRIVRWDKHNDKSVQGSHIGNPYL